jgi:hypothetical protein
MSENNDAGDGGETLEVENVSAAGLAGPILEDMPEINRAAVAAGAENADETGASPSGDGEKGGKKRGRPRKAFIGGDAPDKEPGGAPAPGAADRFDLTADVYCRAFYGAASALLSDEWMPDDETEHTGLRNSVAAYLRASEMEDLPSGMALALAVTTYAARRVPRPRTMGRLATARAWLAARWCAFMGRRAAGKIEKLPPPVNNDAGEGAPAAPAAFPPIPSP